MSSKEPWNDDAVGRPIFDELERYVLNPESLDESDLHKCESMVSENPWAAEFVDFVDAKAWSGLFHLHQRLRVSDDVEPSEESEQSVIANDSSQVAQQAQGSSLTDVEHDTDEPTPGSDSPIVTPKTQTDPEEIDRQTVWDKYRQRLDLHKIGNFVPKPALAAALLCVATLVICVAIWKRQPLAALPVGTEMAITSAKIAVAENRFSFNAKIDPAIVETVLLHLGPEPSDVYKVYDAEKDQPEASLAHPVHWTQPKSFRMDQPRIIHPVIEYVPFANVTSRYGLERQLVRTESLFAITPQGIVEQKIDELNAIVADLGLDEPFRFEDPHFFRVDGTDRIAITMEANPYLCRDVVISWGSKSQTINLSGPHSQPSVKMQRINEQSPAFEAHGGFTHISAKVTIKLDQLVRERLPEFLFRETYSFQREFLLTPLGLIADATPPVATLDEIASLGTKPSHRYLVTGTALPQPNAERRGMLLISPVESTKDVIGAVFDLSDDGQFRARCYLGTDLDGQDYNIHVLVANQLNAKSYSPGDELERASFDWQVNGFIKTGLRFKKNDGTDGFDKR